MNKITLAVVFARGGSKGLKGKNIRVLGGKSLLAHSISVAKSSDQIAAVFVSTDDDRIAQEAEKNGAIVIKRPSKLATDESAEWLSWQHAVEFLRKSYGHFDGIVSLPTTSPLRNLVDVEKCISQFYRSNCDACISITPADRHPDFNMVFVDEDQLIRFRKNSSGRVTRRQDATPMFNITTVAYIACPSFVLNSASIFDGDVGYIEVPRERAVDIDDELDFFLAEALYTRQGGC